MMERNRATRTESTSSELTVRGPRHTQLVEKFFAQFEELEKKREDASENKNTKLKSAEQKKAEIYTFKVDMNLGKKNIYRELMIRGSSSLYEFAQTIIVEAFGFEDFGHAFGFYDNVEWYNDSMRAYTYFYDCGGALEPHEESVEHSFISDVFEVGQTWFFLFDYGANWEFLVECRNIVSEQVGETYPKVTKMHGVAPPQYVYDSD